MMVSILSLLKKHDELVNTVNSLDSEIMIWKKEILRNECKQKIYPEWSDCIKKDINMYKAYIREAEAKQAVAIAKAEELRVKIKDALEGTI